MWSVPTQPCLLLYFLDFCDAVILANKLGEQVRQLKIVELVKVFKWSLYTTKFYNDRLIGSFF